MNVEDYIQQEMTRHQPRTERRWEYADDGLFFAEIYDDNGVVSVVTYPGDTRHRAFTKLEMWLYPYLYTVTLPKCYHTRWLRRLAREFAHRCWVASSDGN